MKHLSALVMELVFTAFAAVAFARQSAPPPPGSGLPPPGINDPGVKQSSIPLPSTSVRPSVAPAAEQDANGDAAPTVSVHTQSNGDRVEEYRRGATLYMIRITPKNGVTQTFMVNGGTGKLIRDPRMGPVDPVYYTIYKWGTPPKPASSSG
ncbi:MAG TPA: DUF2782 domain-containing protein [Rhodanobacteraceae bacterium]|nr:DUF2782 domain-containing protein [Rhodanobacteraceae bacterium]